MSKEYHHERFRTNDFEREGSTVAFEKKKYMDGGCLRVSSSDRAIGRTGGPELFGTERFRAKHYNLVWCPWLERPICTSARRCGRRDQRRFCIGLDDHDISWTDRDSHVFQNHELRQRIATDIEQLAESS